VRRPRVFDHRRIVSTAQEQHPEQDTSETEAPRVKAASLDDTQASMDPPAGGAGSVAGPLLLCADLISAASRETDGEKLLQSLVRAATKHLDAFASHCWLLDGTRNLLQPAARAGGEVPFQTLGGPIPVRQTVIGEVAHTRRPVVVDDLRCAEDAEVRDWARREGIHAFACVPMESSTRLLGVVSIFRRAPFDPESLLALHAVLRLAASQFERCATDGDLRQSNEFMQSLVRSAPVGIVALDEQQRVTLWNQEAERTLGWTREEMLGHRYLLVPDEGRAGFDDQFAQVLAGQKQKRVETLRRHADGRLVPVQGAMFPMYNAAGDVGGAVEFLVDLSRQKHAERCLRTQLAVSRILAACETIEQAAAPSLRATCEIFGWRHGEFWLRPEADAPAARIAAHAAPGCSAARFLSAIPADELHPERGLVGRILAAGGVWHKKLSECEGSLRAGWAQRDGLQAAIGVPIVLGGEVRGAVCFVAENLAEPDHGLRELMSSLGEQFGQALERERTRASLAAAEDNLRQSQKMDAIGLLAGGVAHDFNNILSVILAYSEIGLDEVAEDEPLHESLSEIHQAGQRAAALTRQLLAFSRRQVFRPESVDLNRLAEEMERMLRRLIGPKIVYESSLSRPLHRVTADAAQLEQVLLNLVVNARDAMPDGGSIRVATRNAELDARSMPAHVRAEPGAYAVLSVADTGCGMDAATQARIFEPFFTTKAPGKGTGMGLSTVYGIVQQSGGFLTVDSTPGVGTTFTVYLPRAKHALATQQVHEQLDELPPGAGTILVAEADETLRRVVRRILEVRGYQVLEAGDGAEALELVRQQAQSIDLLLAECLLPVIDGKELADRIRRDAPRVKVLLMSGCAEATPDGTGSPVDDAGFLQKPFTSEVLVRQVHLLLNG